MIPVPYNSDAPLYHWPIATGCLIVLNVVLHFSVPMKMYRPLGDHFLEVEQQHQEMKLREQAKEGQQADDGDQAEIPLGNVAEAIKPDWGNENAEWKQGDFVDPDEQGAEGGVPFQVLALERDNTSQFPANTLALQHGKFKPWQWFTSMFFHYDVLHLVFNMIALWAFGLVVEGKVGSFIFLALYLLIGASQAATEQTLMIFSSSGHGTIGSTAAIFGALGIAVIWAPSNDLDCFWAYGFRFGTVEIPIMIYGFIILLVQTVYGLLLSYLSPSSMLQLIGLPLGCAVGFVWLQAKWVDCEGWDIINVWKGNEGHSDKHAQSEEEAFQLVRHSMRNAGQEQVHPHAAYFGQSKSESQEPSSEQFASFFNSLNAANASPPPLVETIKNVAQLIDQGQFSQAALMYQRVTAAEPQTRLPQARLDRLMRGLLAEKHFQLSVPVMLEYIKRFEENRLQVQLNVAKVLVHLQNPSRVLAILKSIDRSKLDEAQKGLFQKLAAHAKKQLEDGVVELQ